MSRWGFSAYNSRMTQATDIRPDHDTLRAGYDAARQRAALWVRRDRGLIEARGADRAAWLSNLVTNVVKTLADGDGNYAFAVDVKGRTIFDMNILVCGDPAGRDGNLLLDVDSGWTAAALKHLQRYMISEDVTLQDVTAAHGRLALMGPRVAEWAAALGVGNLAPMAQLQHVAIGSGDAAIRVIRHDLAGVMGAEIIVTEAGRDALLARVREAGQSLGCVEIGDAVVDVLRCEAGIPWPRRDIDAEVVPPETLQIERGINYHKGCYLGQEVIERMRSHGVVARRWIGLRIEGRDVPTPPLNLKRDGTEAGRITSTVWSFALNAPLALGYARSAHAAVGTKLSAATADGQAFGGEVISLPARRP